MAQNTPTGKITPGYEEAPLLCLGTGDRMCFLKLSEWGRWLSHLIVRIRIQAEDRHIWAPVPAPPLTKSVTRDKAF